MTTSSEDGSNNSVSDYCGLCGDPVDRHNRETWKQVRGWVGGPRKDSMRLREDTGWFAHHLCVAKVQEGQAVDQPDMFEFDEEPLRPAAEEVQLPDVWRD